MNWKLASAGVYKLHDLIYQGPFPQEPARATLLELGVTRFINVAGFVYSDQRFVILSRPFPDHQSIKLPDAEACLAFFRESVQLDAPTFIHCAAGQNRSGAIAFLCLLSLGLPEPEAIRLIESNTLDAVAKNTVLIGAEHLQLARGY